MATKNLKVLMSGDTKPYRQEVDQAAKATKVMKDDIGGHLDSLAGLFGTSMGTIGKSADKVSLLFNGLLTAFSTAAAGGTAFATASAQLSIATTAVAAAESAAALSSERLALAQTTAGISAEALSVAELEAAGSAAALALAQGSLATAQTAVTVATGFGTVAMQIFKVALVSTGIGALVVVMGSLVAYFTSTREGAAKIKIAFAEIGAVINVLKDRLSTLGEGMWKLFTLDFKGAGAALSGVFSGIGKEMVDEASAAGDLAKMTQALNKEERDNIVIQAQRLAKSAELRNDAKQEGVDSQDKKRMLAESKALIIAYYDEEKHIATGRRDIAMQDSAMHKNMGDELTKLEEAKAKVYAIDQESAEAQKALAREMKGVNKEIAAQEAALIAKNIAERKADSKLVIGGNVKMEGAKLTTPDTLGLMLGSADSLETKAANIRAMFKSLADDVKKDTIDLSGSLASAGDSFGTFLGNMLSGKDSMAGFGTFITKAMADLATTVGKQMIAFGVAGIALKGLLKNPWTALAAGIALVALGQMANNAIGDSVSGAGGNSSSGTDGSGNYNYNTRSAVAAAANQNINVTVNGTLSADAKGLSTTLTKENTRVSVAT
ncbi:MAG: hypothetical protein WCJ95_09460 [Mariniphaga sp.]